MFERCSNDVRPIPFNHATIVLRNAFFDHYCKSSDFQCKSRHATTIKNKNYAQRLHQKITSAKQKHNETTELAEGEIIDVETYKLLDEEKRGCCGLKLLVPVDM